MCRSILLLLIFVTPLAPGAHAAERRVAEVVFLGNDKTQELVLLQELTFELGEPLDELSVERSRQALMDLGLFTDVRADMTTIKGATVVTYTVKEKRYFYVLPRFSRSSDGKLTLGAQLQFDNLMGLNQHLKIKTQRSKEEDGSGNTSHLLKIDYALPRIGGSRFGVDLDLENGGSEEDAFSGETEVGQVDSDANGFGLNLSWLIYENSRKEQWSTFIGFSTLRREFELVSGSMGDFVSGRDNVVRGGVGFDGVHQDKFRRWGNAYGIELTIGDGSIGSDFDYSGAFFYYRRYLPIGRDRLDNFNFQFRAGHFDGAAFGEFAYSLGGSKTLRGIEHEDVRGFSMVLLNAEYLLRFHHHPRLRVVMFSDIGNAFAKNEFDITDLEATIGSGIRWKIPSFVNVDVRIDFGYDTGSGNKKLYLGTNHVF